MCFHRGGAHAMSLSRRLVWIQCASSLGLLMSIAPPAVTTQQCRMGFDDCQNHFQIHCRLNRVSIHREVDYSQFMSTGIFNIGFGASAVAQCMSKQICIITCWAACRLATRRNCKLLLVMTQPDRYFWSAFQFAFYIFQLIPFLHGTTYFCHTVFSYICNHGSWWVIQSSWLFLFNVIL